jgi:hypothetical protein
LHFQCIFGRRLGQVSTFGWPTNADRSRFSGMVSQINVGINVIVVVNPLRHHHGRTKSVASSSLVLYTYFQTLVGSKKSSSCCALCCGGGLPWKIRGADWARARFRQKQGCLGLATLLRRQVRPLTVRLCLIHCVVALLGALSMGRTVFLLDMQCVWCQKCIKEENTFHDMNHLSNPSQKIRNLLEAQHYVSNCCHAFPLFRLFSSFTKAKINLPR